MSVMEILQRPSPSSPQQQVIQQRSSPLGRSVWISKNRTVFEERGKRAQQLRSTWLDHSIHIPVSSSPVTSTSELSLSSTSEDDLYITDRKLSLENASSPMWHSALRLLNTDHIPSVTKDGLPRSPEHQPISEVDVGELFDDDFDESLNSSISVVLKPHDVVRGQHDLENDLGEIRTQPVTAQYCTSRNSWSVFQVPIHAGSPILSNEKPATDRPYSTNNMSLQGDQVEKNFQLYHPRMHEYANHSLIQSSKSTQVFQQQSTLIDMSSSKTVESSALCHRDIDASITRRQSSPPSWPSLVDSHTPQERRHPRWSYRTSPMMAVKAERQARDRLDISSSNTVLHDTNQRSASAIKKATHRSSDWYLCNPAGGLSSVEIAPSYRDDGKFASSRLASALQLSEHEAVKDGGICRYTSMASSVEEYEMNTSCLRESSPDIEDRLLSSSPIPAIDSCRHANTIHDLPPVPRPNLASQLQSTFVARIHHSQYTHGLPNSPPPPVHTLPSSTQSMCVQTSTSPSPLKLSQYPADDVTMGAWPDPPAGYSLEPPPIPSMPSPLKLLKRSDRRKSGAQASAKSSRRHLTTTSILEKSAVQKQQEQRSQSRKVTKAKQRALTGALEKENCHQGGRRSSARLKAQRDNH